MQVALASGQVWIAHLAQGSGVRETVICSDVFDAFRGETGFRDGVFLDQALFAQVATLIGPRATVAPASAGARVLTPDTALPLASAPAVCSPADAAIIAGYVPGYLRDLPAGVGTDWLAEFRSAQIAFARFSGFRFRGPDDLPGLAALSRGLRQAIEGNGGVRLEPFSRDGSVALVNAPLNVVESAPAIVDPIHIHAEGHPLFTAALALSLRDQGLLQIEAGYAHLRPGEKGTSQIAVPDEVGGGSGGTYRQPCTCTATDAQGCGGVGPDL